MDRDAVAEVAWGEETERLKPSFGTGGKWRNLNGSGLQSEIELAFDFGGNDPFK